MTKEREQEREGQVCAWEKRHESWEVLRIKITRLCEPIMQQALRPSAEGRTALELT